MSLAPFKKCQNSEHYMIPPGSSKNYLKPSTRDLLEIDKQRVFTSTPKVYVQCGSSASSSTDNTVIESLKISSISGIDLVSPNKQWQNAENVSKQCTQQSVIDNTVIQVETNEPEKCKEVKKPLNIVTTSFRSHNRDKCKKDNKPKNVKKNLEEEKNQRVLFRANPLPKYLKARKMQISRNKNKNAEKMDCDAIDKKQEFQSSNKNKKSTEISKKPSFVPYSVHKNLSSPKTSSLRTKTQVKKRIFNTNLEENEIKVQQQRPMELATKEKQEEEEISLLRKQTVHKAEPIRKYRMDLPKIPKRPLTDPKTPMVLKRRRLVQ